MHPGRNRLSSPGIRYAWNASEDLRARTEAVGVTRLEPLAEPDILAREGTGEEPPDAAQGRSLTAVKQCRESPCVILSRRKTTYRGEARRTAAIASDRPLRSRFVAASSRRSPSQAAAANPCCA